MTIIIARHSRSKGFSESRPCVDCFETIKKIKIVRHIIYTNGDGVFEKIKVENYIATYVTSARRAKNR